VQGDVKNPSGVRGLAHQLGPVLTAATMFSISDIAGKYSLESGSDVLTLLSFRSVVGIGLLLAWMRLGSAPAALPPRLKWISIGLGLLLTLNLFWVFKAIELVPVSIAILTYFIYPLLTGLAGAATGIDRLTWRGFATAVVAFLGLGLIIGANPVQLEVLGLVAAVGAAFTRMAMLLITRAALASADARLVTWYTLWSSMAVFVGVSLVTWNWHPPHTAMGWVAFVGIGHHDRDPDALCLDPAHRPVPLRALHEPRAADDHRVEHDHPRRPPDGAPIDRRDRHDCGAVRIPVAEVR
jgi:probable blue pigment (indigoidine) exporter